jgi:hypothetical protein
MKFDRSRSIARQNAERADNARGGRRRRQSGPLEIAIIREDAGSLARGSGRR